MLRLARCLTALALLAITVTGFCGSSLSMERATIDGGGGESTGAGFTLRSTVGQTDTARLASGNFVLQGGFWFSDAPQDAELLFKDGLE